jgi:hypothetical protein
MKNVRFIDIPKISDPRGNLAVIEGDTVPFRTERVYYLYDVPSHSKRGGHAHKLQLELLIPISGSFYVKVDNGSSTESILLNDPNKGLLIEKMVWRELEGFSSGSICLVLNSGKFIEEDYIRDYQDFINATSKD